MARIIVKTPAKRSLKASSKQKIKTVAKAVGIVALSANVGVKYQEVANRQARKKIFREIKETRIKKPVDRLDASTNSLKEYNKHSNISEIYFHDGKKLSKINIDVAKLSQLNRLMPAEVKTNVNQIIDRKVQAVNREMNNNPNLKNKIERRIGVNDYRRYLLSLPVEKLETVFTKKELEAIRQEIIKIPKNNLKELYSKTSKAHEQSVGYGALISLFLGAGLFELTKKKKEPFDYK